MSVRFLARYSDRALVDAIQQAAGSRGLHNVFNVSLVRDGGGVHCTFRALPESGEKPFRAYYAMLGANLESSSLVDLTERAAGFGVPVVADPKLFATADGVFITFNTGQPPEGEQNDVFLMRLWPEPGEPQRCLLPEGRARVEKNWAFVDPGDGLVALYGLAPLTTLRLVGGDIGRSGDLVFAKSSVVRRSTLPGVALSIGTQMIAADGGFVFVSHEKVGIRARRVYLGRLARVSLTEAGFDNLRISGVRLLHSPSSVLLPHRPRHNPALISATYFAGIQREGPVFTLSYGVNDLSIGVAKVPEELLWR